MTQTTIIAGDSMKAKHLAQFICQRVVGDVNVTSLNAERLFDPSSQVFIFIIPAQKESYKQFKSLLRTISPHLEKKKIVFISTEGTEVHHGIMQMMLRGYTEMARSIQLPTEVICVKANGSIIENKTIRKKFAPLWSELMTQHLNEVVS